MENNGSEPATKADLSALEERLADRMEQARTETRELLEQSRTENRELIEQSRLDLLEHIENIETKLLTAFQAWPTRSITACGSSKWATPGWENVWRPLKTV